MLPSITNVINLADSHDRAAFAMVTHVKQEPRERENSESKEEVGPHPRRLCSQPPGALGRCSISRGGSRARGTDQNLSLLIGLSVVPVQLPTVSFLCQGIVDVHPVHLGYNVRIWYLCVVK